MVIEFSYVDFGFGKASMSSLLEEEALDLVEKIKKFDGADMRVENTFFTISIFNVIWRIVAGERYEVCIGSQF